MFPSAQRSWGDPESRYRGPSEYCYANFLKVVLFAYPTYLNHPKCDALRKMRTERTDGVGRRTQRDDLWLSFNLDESQVSQRLLTAAGQPHNDINPQCRILSVAMVQPRFDVTPFLFAHGALWSLRMCWTSRREAG